MVTAIPLQGAGAAFMIWLVFMAVFLYLVYWTYQDAQKHSSHPPFLWAIVVFLAPLLGLVLYLILGRDRRGGSRGPSGY